MTLPVGHGLDQGLIGADRAQQPVRELLVRQLGTAADVVDLPRPALVRDQLDAAAVVVDARLLYHRTYGLPVVITRCSNNYGPHQFPEKMIPLFISNLLDGQRVPLYGDGMNVRDSPFAGVLSEEERQATLTTFREHWQDEHAA